MCTNNEKETFNVDAATKWNDDLQVLLKSIPKGVTVIAVTSTKIDERTGLFTTGCEGTGCDLMNMLLRLIDQTPKVHELFEKSKLIYETQSNFKNSGFTSLSEAFKNHFKNSH